MRHQHQTFSLCVSLYASPSLDGSLGAVAFTPCHASILTRPKPKKPEKFFTPQHRLQVVSTNFFLYLLSRNRANSGAVYRLENFFSARTHFHVQLGVFLKAKWCYKRLVPPRKTSPTPKKFFLTFCSPCNTISH